MLVCTCGSKFKTVKVGEVVVIGTALYACDVKECPKCAKRILHAAECAITCDPLRISSIVDSMIEKGGTVYGGNQ